MKKQMHRQMKGELLTWTEWWAFAVFSYLECLIHTEDGITSSVLKRNRSKEGLVVRNHAKEDLK